MIPGVIVVCNKQFRWLIYIFILYNLILVDTELINEEKIFLIKNTAHSIVWMRWHCSTLYIFFPIYSEEITYFSPFHLLFSVLSPGLFVWEWKENLWVKQVSHVPSVLLLVWDLLTWMLAMAADIIISNNFLVNFSCVEGVSNLWFIRLCKTKRTSWTLFTTLQSQLPFINDSAMLWLHTWSLSFLAYMALLYFFHDFKVFVWKL